MSKYKLTSTRYKKDMKMQFFNYFFVFTLMFLKNKNKWKVLFNYSIVSTYMKYSTLWAHMSYAILLKDPLGQSKKNIVKYIYLFG